MFDAHIHMDKYEEAERDALLASAFEAGLTGVVAVSVDFASCEANRALAARWPGRVIPAYGYHPEQPPLPDAELERLCGWIRGLPRGETFAIGEVGLPYFLRQESAGSEFDLAPYMRQMEAFVRLAAELDRPIALHAVHEDADAVMDLLSRYGVRRAHFHWFKGSPQTTRRLAEGGYCISVTPEVLYDEETRHLARFFPLEQLMVETDGPWPFEGPYAGKQTEPSMVADAVGEIARLRGVNETAVRESTAAATRRLYGIS